MIALSAAHHDLPTLSLHDALPIYPGKLPGSVVWAVWDGMDGPIIDRENVTLDSQFAVHRYLRLAETTVVGEPQVPVDGELAVDRKSTRLNSSHRCISYAVFCLKKK